MEGVPTTARYCEAHSRGVHVALCPFPNGGATSCHECGSGVDRTEGNGVDVHVELLSVPNDSPAVGRTIAAFCSKPCSQAWTLAHDGFWNA